MMNYGETPQNEIGFSFLDVSAASGVIRLINAGPIAFYSNNAASRVQPPAGPLRQPTPSGMYLGNEGPGAIRYMCGGPNQNQHPNTAMGVLVPAGGVIDWTAVMTNYAALIRNFEFVVVSGTAILQVSWRD